MLTLAIKYIFDILKVSKVTLCVFHNNSLAYNCYKAVGFKEERYVENAFSYKDETWGTYHMKICLEDINYQ